MKNSMKISVRLPFCFSVCPDHKKTPACKQNKDRKTSDEMLMILVRSVIEDSPKKFLGILNNPNADDMSSSRILFKHDTYHYTSKTGNLKKKNM